MADHRAEQIADAVVTKVTSLATTGANVFRGRVHEIPDTSLPALCVYVGTDVPRSDGASSSFRFIDGDLTVLIEAVAKASSGVDSTLIQIRKEVTVALAADVTQGLSFVMNTDEGPASIDLNGDGDKPVGRMRMDWTFRYRRSRTDPSA